VVSMPGQGTTFNIYIPASEDFAQEKAAGRFWVRKESQRSCIARSGKNLGTNWSLMLDLSGRSHVQTVGKHP
jgi:hypothetical protein